MLSASANPSSALCQSVTFERRPGERRQPRQRHAHRQRRLPPERQPDGNDHLEQRGRCLVHLEPKTAGSLAIAANYQGDSNFSTNAASLTQTVNAAVNCC